LRKFFRLHAGNVVAAKSRLATHLLEKMEEKQFRFFVRRFILTACL
jgi:hypothetical protein